MTGTGRRRCRSSAFTQSAQDATATPRCAATLPRRASVQLWRCAWLGVSAAAVSSFFSSNAEAFVQPAAGGALRIEAQSGGDGRAGTVVMSERRGLWPQRSTIDLRSDTVTQPTGGMRKAMQKAEVGDDVLGEDPTIKRLEAETAELLGKEAALFVPSGTMANLIAHLVWCSQRGSEMILGDQSHAFLWEQANAAQFGGVGYRSLPNLPDGTIDLGAIAAAVRGNNPCFPVSRLVSIENTQAQCGGKVLSIEYLDNLANLAQEEGLRVHMDGARIWNAAASSNLPLSRIVAGVDSVSVCYSKGLGAPVGSAIVGTADFISRATRVRKALGGGMRQSGVVAAAALEGLRKQLPRIGEDHANAWRLAQGLYDLGMPDAVGVDPSSVQTNIVLATIGPDLTDEGMTASVVCDRLREKGVLGMAIMQGVIRFVTHSQVTSADIQRTVLMMKEVLEEAGLRPEGVNRPPRAAPIEEPVVDELEWRSDDQPAGAADPPAAAATTTTTAAQRLSLADGPAGQQALREVYTGPDSLLDGESPSSAAGEETAAVETGSAAAAAAESSSVGDAAATAVAGAAEFGGEGETGMSSSRGVSMVSGGNGAGTGGGGEGLEDEEEKDDAPPFLEQFEEVELQGMTVSSEGFVAIMTSKESPRALKLVVTPDDPMSGGLDVEQAETSEARTLLQLMQGIDVARHLPGDALSDLMDLSLNSGVQLSTVYVSRVDPFSATLMAKVPQRDSETLPSPAAAAAAAATAAAAASDAASARAAAGADEAWIDGGAAAAAAAAAAATTADRGGFDGSREAGSERETLVSSSVPGTTMGSGYGRPRLGVSKIAETTNSFEALGLALRYPSTRIFVRAGKKVESSVSCFDSADVAELYPNLMKLADARTRRSASDDMNTQFEVQKIRQQLESAMNAGDSDRISALREELNSLVVPDSNTAPVS